VAGPAHGAAAGNGMSLRTPVYERGRRRWRERALAALATVTLMYAVIAAALWWGQERLLFRPAPLPTDFKFKLGADVHESWLDVPGARLNVLHLKLPQPGGVVFFLHGNGGNLSSWFVNVDWYRRQNLDLYMIDYRGYGKSSGRIESEAQLHADVRAAWDHVAPAYAGKRRIVYGRSLGTALAAKLAADVQPDMTVLVSPFSGMLDLAREQFPLLPRPLLAAVLRYPLQTAEAVAKLRGPLWMAHGERDTLIPPVHSERLLAIAPADTGATLLRLPLAAHGDVHQFSDYLDGLAAALRSTGSTASTASTAR